MQLIGRRTKPRVKGCGIRPAFETIPHERDTILDFDEQIEGADAVLQKIHDLSFNTTTIAISGRC